MIIGILTYHAACNFGANLQVLSTVSYFRNNGHEPIIIDWFTEELENAYRKNTQPEQFIEHLNFQKKYLPLSKRCYNDDDIIKVINENQIEAIVVGSDAVAQHHPLLSRIVFPCRKIIAISKPTMDRMCPNPFWGSFNLKLEKKIPLIMMSVSSQNSEYKYLTRKEKNSIKDYISKFSYISTRDEWTSKMFQYVSNKKINPTVTPDPVFAFNYNVDFQPSKEAILQKFNLPSKYYLFSFFDQKYVSVDWLSKFEELASNKGITCVAFPFPQGIKFKHPFKTEINIPLSPLEWYALIKYSQGYIGNNMHPIVVSLHNGIPCFSFDNYGIVKLRVFVNKNSSKIFHIMKIFGVLENHKTSSGMFYKTPTPQFVFDKLESYNSENVLKIGNIYLTKYMGMMKNIISTFKS